MKKSIIRLMPILFAGMLVSSGCAKTGAIKNEQPLVQAAAKPAGTVSVRQIETPAKAAVKPIASTNAKSATLVTNELNKLQQPNTALLTAELQKKLEKIFFDFDSAKLSENACQILTRNYAVLQQTPQARIRIEGNCDERGSDEYNLALGERRARVAANYLTTLGIPGERLSTISYGKEKPADPGHDEKAWAKSRRDEFVITSR